MRRGFRRQRERCWLGSRGGGRSLKSPSAVCRPRAPRASRRGARRRRMVRAMKHTMLRRALALAAATFVATACTPARSPRIDGLPTCSAEGGATWREIQSEHFRVVTDLDAGLLESELAHFERAYDAMVQAAFPLGAPGRARLIVFRNSRELHAFLPNSVAGVFMPDLAMEDDETGTALFGGGLRDDSRAVFQHELAHRLLTAGFDDVPPWFHEGLAMYLESMRVEGNRIILGDPVRADTPLHRLPSVHDVTTLAPNAFYRGSLRRDVDQATADEVAANYDASWHFMHLLRNGPDRIRDEFRRAVATTNEGAPFELAFRAFVDHVGDGPLEKEFRLHARNANRLSSVFAFTPSPRRAPLALRELSPEETHLLWAKILLQGPTPQRALEEIDEALRHTPRSLRARIARAHAELTLRRTAEAIQSFEAIVAEAPTNAAALAGLFHALLDRPRARKNEAAPPPARIGELAPRLTNVATTADEHTMALVALYISGDAERALHASANAVRAHPTSYRLQELRAALLANAGRYREAALAARRALNALPESLLRSGQGRELAERLEEYRAAITDQ